MRAMEPDLLPSIFRTELEPATFDSMIDSLGKCVLEPSFSSSPLPEDLDWTRRWLEGISRIQRFELTLQFADKGENQSKYETFLYAPQPNACVSLIGEHTTGTVAILEGLIGLFEQVGGGALNATDKQSCDLKLHELRKAYKLMQK